MPPFDRRQFLAGAAAGAALSAASATRVARAAAGDDPIVLAVMGLNGRGSALAEMFAAQPDVRIAYVCDCDERVIGKGIAAATSRGGAAPKGVKDFRTALDDPAVDALVCAAPNHWHAPATILGCRAGKHVYVEKPCCHTAEEGEEMIRAARDAGRVVQVGMQRRSGPLYQRMVERVREGALGKVLYARSTYYNNRPSIGHGQGGTPPAELDYALWQGPAPDMPYHDNYLHYNWHWFWHWGNGEIGNNGVHTIDVCRWALGVDYPSKVAMSGSRQRYDDDQQTPDQAIAYFEFDGRTIVWEGVSWSPSVKEEDQFVMEVRGEGGTLTVNDGGYVIYDMDRNVVEQHAAGRGDDEHIRNFLDAVRGKAEPNAGVVDGHKSALLCHLGNIAYRTGAAIEIDSATGRIKDNAAAQQLWRREYRKGWELEGLGARG